MQVKENVLPQPPLSICCLCLATLASLLTLAAVALVDYNLPAPLTKETTSKELFIGEIAYDHLINLTSIGPRVAGSYENEVLAVRVLVLAVQDIARAASPHHRVELDVQYASGAFSLSFLDGLNNMYRGVQNVVARVTATGGRASRRRTALLLNCHFDTVPDSPGASDDAAGCAVLLGVMRALVASKRPHRHDVVFLFNGAEENILQGSHGFVTQHQWAKSVRAFINIEACGSGGREVLFQAGPNDPWIVEEYARSVPRPFASSLAQELFESGLIPADTDFRIFRDFGHLSGVDLAWSANGYVYHTRLDEGARVPPAALQHTGENVLALVHGLLNNERLESDPEPWSRQPVFFDVVGEFVVCVRASTAAGAVLAALALVWLKIQLNAQDAAKKLYIRRALWWRLVCGEAGWLAAACCVGLGCSAAAALLLRAVGAPLAFYSRGWLLAPLYATPALCGAWVTMSVLGSCRGPLVREWWGLRAGCDALALCSAVMLAGAAMLALRSGFLPWLWAAALPAADVLTHLMGGSDGVRVGAWCALGVVAGAQSWYMALSWLALFVPLTARAGAAHTELLMASLTASSVLTACCWLLPLAASARHARRLAYYGLSVTAVAMVLVALTPLGAPYSAARPQRLMVFHTRTTRHPPLGDRISDENWTEPENLYWVPQLDANTLTSVNKLFPEMSWWLSGGEECLGASYCGAPYFLPARSLVPAGAWLRPATHAPPLSAPRTAVTAHLELAPLNDTTHILHINVTGPSHIVVVVTCAEGVQTTWAEGSGAGGITPLPTKDGSAPSRPVYFFTLFDAAPQPGQWNLKLYLQRSGGLPSDGWAQLLISGHSMWGEDKLAPEHKSLLDTFPQWTAPTGWGVDLHLYDV